MNDPITHLYTVLEQLNKKSDLEYELYSRDKFINWGAFGTLEGVSHSRDIYKHFQLWLSSSTLCNHSDASMKEHEEEARQWSFPHRSKVTPNAQRADINIDTSAVCVHASIYFDDPAKNRARNGKLPLGPAGSGPINFDIHINQPTPGTYITEQGLCDGERKDHSFEDLFSDIALSGSNDFRPYIHRMAELYVGVPRSRLHNPLIYAPKTALLAQTAAALLTVQEQSIFSQTALMREYYSVPRMSLGTIKMPVREVIGGVRLLDTYLAQEKIPLATEDRLAQRLANYVMHDFQRDTTTAQEILALLQQEPR